MNTDVVGEEGLHKSQIFVLQPPAQLLAGLKQALLLKSCSYIQYNSNFLKVVCMTRQLQGIYQSCTLSLLLQKAGDDKAFPTAREAMTSPIDSKRRGFLRC